MLYPVRRPITTLDCVLLKERSLVFRVGLGEPASWSLLSSIVRFIPVIALIEYFQRILTYFVVRVGCCFMLRLLTVLPVAVPLPCFRYLCRTCRDTYVVSGEILYFLYFRHKNGNIVNKEIELTLEACRNIISEYMVI